MSYQQRYARHKTREVSVGGVVIGGDNPIRVQSMTTTDTFDLEGTVVPLADIAGTTCNLPSGQPSDPAYDLHFQEFGPFSGMILDRSIFWRSIQEDLWFDILCGPATYVDLERGCTVCAKHYWEAEACMRGREAEHPESSGDRLALRLYGSSEDEDS